MADEQMYGDLLHTMVESIVQTVIGPQGQSIIDRVMPEIEGRIKEEYGFLPEIHDVKTEKGTNRVIGTTHEKFDSILRMVQMDVPVYLMGPAGCGKNVICKQVAEGLGLDFYFSNAITQEYKLTGFIDANGTYQETQFYKAFTKGGLFFLDEMDASIPEVLITLNAAIANRYFDFPTGKVDAHEDFRVIAAGNTFGTGADNNYTGRYCLDRASLDRFAVVNIDYSEKVEEAIVDHDAKLLDFCHTFRDVVAGSGVNCLFTYRSLERIHQMQDIMDLGEVLVISLLKELDKDTITQIVNKMQKFALMSDNKYLTAMKQLTEEKKEETPSGNERVAFSW